MRSLARAVQASTAAASGSPAPKRAWKRKKRRIRRWSSAMRCSGIADEADVARLEVVEPAEIVEHLAGHRDRRTSALMVKSRRAASSFQSSVKATVARRPSVRDVAPEARDLERMAVADGGDGAMVDARSAPP